MSSEIESIPTEPIQLTDTDDLESAVSTYDAVLVDFHADWCGPCRMMEPTVEAIAAETDAAVVKVDVDRFQGLATQYGIQGIPALLLFSEGELAERLVGVQQAESLKRTISKYTE